MRFTEPIVVDRVVPYVRDASVYVDDAQAAALNWSCRDGLASLFHHGAANIKRFAPSHQQQQQQQQPSSSRVCGLQDAPRKLFLVSTHVHQALPDIQIIASSSPTHTLTVMTTTPYRYPPDASMGTESAISAARDELMQELRELMIMSFVQAGLSPPEPDELVVNVEYYPMNSSDVLDDLVLLRGALRQPGDDTFAAPPSHWRAMPTAHSDHTGIAAREFAVELFGLMECLEARPEIWHAGAFAGNVGRELVQMRERLEVDDQGRNTASVILMDRTLDVSALCGDEDSLLSQIFDVLPRSDVDTADVQVPLRHLDMPSWSASTISGSLSHQQNADARQLLSDVASMPLKDATAQVRKALIDITITENIQVKLPRILGKVTPTQLEKIVKAIQQHSDAGVLDRHQQTLVMASAVLAVLEAEKQEQAQIYATTARVIRTIVANAAQSAGRDNIVQSVVEVLSSAREKLTAEQMRKLGLLAVSMLARLLMRGSSSWLDAVADVVCDSEQSDRLAIRAEFGNVVLAQMQNAASVQGQLMEAIFQDVASTANSKPGDSANTAMLTHIPGPRATTPVGYFGGFSRLLASTPVISSAKTIVVVLCGAVGWQEVQQLRNAAATWKQASGGGRAVLVGFHLS
ncbi:Sec1 domain-containing protein 2 [Sorochytrium milnesiophthora]